MHSGYLLIADDREINRARLMELLSRDFPVIEAENGQMALETLDQYGDDIVLVLLAADMPVLDGYAVLESMRARNLSDHIPVIITSLDARADEARLFDLGASDIIMNPFHPLVVRKRVMNIAEQYRRRSHLEQLAKEQARHPRDEGEAMMNMLGAIFAYRSMETGRHIVRVRGFTELLLTELAADCPEYGLDTREIALISSASAMHDIGKIIVPDAVLNKPGRLTPDEFDIMKTHTTGGAAILGCVDCARREDYFAYAVMICRHHHERWDGGGYPDKLVGEQIPISAQTVGLADCYDALTMHRTYKPVIPHETAVEMIARGQCGVFSEKMQSAFKNAEQSFAQLAKAYADGEDPSNHLSAS